MAAIIQESSTKFDGKTYPYVVEVIEGIPSMTNDERYIWCDDQGFEFIAEKQRNDAPTFVTKGYTVYKFYKYRFSFINYEDAFSFSIRWV